MDTFGKKMAAFRKKHKMTQDEHVIGHYERDETTPSIEVAKKIARFLNTIVGGRTLSA